jgi:hypothetical protein
MAGASGSVAPARQGCRRFGFRRWKLCAASGWRWVAGEDVRSSDSSIRVGREDSAPRFQIQPVAGIAGVTGPELTAGGNEAVGLLRGLRRSGPVTIDEIQMGGPEVTFTAEDAHQVDVYDE